MLPFYGDSNSICPMYFDSASHHAVAGHAHTEVACIGFAIKMVWHLLESRQSI